MELHQIRYFLAVARTLNFTRAAEDCNVSQPSLTRAIKNLEAELGGEMFRRERANTHLTELGRAMLPFLTQSHESAFAAKEQAEALKTGTTASLRLALSHAIDFDVVSEALAEVGRRFNMVNLVCLRVSGDNMLETLRSGGIDIAIAGRLTESWDRLDRWSLYVEPHCVALHVDHPLAAKEELQIADLAGQRLILRPYCQKWKTCVTLLEANGVDMSNNHEVACDRDANRFLEAGLGIAIVPCSLRVAAPLCQVPLAQRFEKSIWLYAVAGRSRSKALTGLINLLRSADWSRFQMLDAVG